MIPDVRETWTVRKPAVRSSAGVVSTQHHLASEIGARVLAEGGNAVDAAVTAGFALGTVEPWMSGLGGCGQMIVHRAGESRAWSVDFGLVASRHLDPADYPLDEGRGSDLFNWPAVEGDRNVMGPLSIAIPTGVAGAAAALERFGTRSFGDCLAPGRRPLANMCPVVVERGGGDRFALGASGGRRIMPAVMQLVSFLVDFGLDLEDAFHAPRIDASGGESVSVDPRFPAEVAAALGERYPVEVWPNAVYPAMYACPNGAGALRDGSRIGAAYVMSPWALAAPAVPA